MLDGYLLYMNNPKSLVGIEPIVVMGKWLEANNFNHSLTDASKRENLLEVKYFHNTATYAAKSELYLFAILALNI
jgi:hypothetical protein